MECRSPRTPSWRRKAGWTPALASQMSPSVTWSTSWHRGALPRRVRHAPAPQWWRWVAGALSAPAVSRTPLRRLPVPRPVLCADLRAQTARPRQSQAPRRHAVALSARLRGRPPSVKTRVQACRQAPGAGHPSRLPEPQAVSTKRSLQLLDHLQRVLRPCARALLLGEQAAMPGLASMPGRSDARSDGANQRTRAYSP